SSSVFSQVQSVSLQAGGLTCSMCSRAIYKSLKKMPEVLAVKEDIAHSTYLIQYKDTENISLDNLKKAVEDAGFSVVRLELKTRFENLEIGKESFVKINDQLFYFIGVPPQSVSGEKKLLVLDKDFLLEKDRKKYESVFPDEKKQAGEKIYHVTLLAS